MSHSLGACVNIPNQSTGLAPLHAAVEGIEDGEYDNFQVICRRLIDKGCVLDAGTLLEYDTPLCLAFKDKKYKIAEVLIAHGSNVTLFDGLIFRHVSYDTNYKLIKMMILAGFNPSLVKIMLNHKHFLSNEICKWLAKKKSAPLNLKDLCRLSIRKRFGYHIFRKSCDLYPLIPFPLIDFLMFEYELP